MNPDLRAKWVADLRANPDLQGHGALRTSDNKYCCLGRLCEIKGIKFNDEIKSYTITIEGEETNFNEDLPVYILKEIHMAKSDEHKLIDMNDDDRLTFLEIADWIQENL